MTETIEERPTEPSDSARVEFPCRNCGARTTWDPVSDALLCDFCGEKTEVPRESGEIVERPLEAAGSAARGLGLELRVARCGNCGARVAYDQAETSEVCIYCGSANVLAQEANRNAIRPESLVPLDVGREAVQESFRHWLRKLWFRPNALKKATHSKAVGIYVPFWTFDCRVHSKWSADAGHYYYVPQTYWVTVNGRPQMRTRMVRKIRWEPAWGAREDAFDDLLVNASRGLPEDLVEELGPFDTRALVRYRAEYLAGWRAEEYQVDLVQAWEAGRERILAIQRSRCAGDVPGDTHRNLRVSNQIADERWKHVLLPVWSLQYRFRGKIYTVLVNGQNGKVVGKAPLSWIKISLFALFLALLAVLALLLGGGLAAL